MVNQGSSDKSPGQIMWGGRFATEPSQIMQRINASIDVDQRLWREDIEGSRAHAEMLERQGILSPIDCAQILQGLDAIAGEIERGEFVFSIALEDIHLNIEHALTERIGEAGKKLHTARSRNDQVATDFKLWVRRACLRVEEKIESLQRVLIEQAQAHHDWVMPGFTHLQIAQPITLGHHLLAYVEMLARDAQRLRACWSHADECPLGAAALAGTSYRIDRQMTAQALGFDIPMQNSLDAVASRDFALEALAVLAIAGAHLSRLAEEIILWSTASFGFARLDDAWSTGSSIMPQKRNPDAAELIRAKAARLSAYSHALLGIVKALPLAYAKDLQEDKRITFEAFDDICLMFDAMHGMMATIRFDRNRMFEAARKGFATATDLADWLVQHLQMPFRDAHHVVGRIVARAEALGIEDLSELPLAEFQTVESRIDKAIVARLNVAQSVKSRTSPGGTAPELVLAQALRWRAELCMDENPDDTQPHEAP